MKFLYFLIETEIPILEIRSPLVESNLALFRLGNKLRFFSFQMLIHGYIRLLLFAYYCLRSAYKTSDLMQD